MTNNNIRKECNEGKHVFINSDFCDRCDIDFDIWYEKVIEQTKKDTCIFLLVVLQSIVEEQIKAKQLRREVGDYIYQAVKDQAIRMRWID